MYNTTEHTGEMSGRDRDRIKEYLLYVFSLKEVRAHCSILSTESSYRIYLPEDIYKEKSTVINERWLHANDKCDGKAPKPIVFSKLEYIDIVQGINITEDILSQIETKSYINQDATAVSFSQVLETEPAFMDFVYECASILTKTLEQLSISKKAQAKSFFDSIMERTPPENSRDLGTPQVKLESEFPVEKNLPIDTNLTGDSYAKYKQQQEPISFGAKAA